MSSERVTIPEPEVEPVETPDPAAEQERLAADLWRLNDLVERDRVTEARQFVKELEQRWPASERVQHWARVLAPPVARRRPDIPARSSAREWQWLREHAHEYPGRWLAIYEDRLIAADPERRVVIAKAREVLGEQGVLLFFQPAVTDPR